MTSTDPKTADRLRLLAGHGMRPRYYHQVVGINRDEPTEEQVKMAMFGAPDFWFEFREPVLVHGLFGIQRRVRFVGVGVDEPERLQEEVQRRIDLGP